MVVTVAPTNHTEINDCDSETSWTFNGIDSDGNLKKEGTQSICGILKISGDNTVTYTPGASIDMSGTKHLRIWYLSTVAAQHNTLALGGVQLWVSDGANTGYYFVSGSDVYQGGWTNLVVDLSRTVDGGTKPTAMNAITSCGIRVNLTSGAKQALNTWLDYFHLADDLRHYGDDGGGYYDMDDIISAEATGGWGVWKKEGGVYFGTGGLITGDTGTGATKFQPKSSIMVFEDRKVNASLYKFNADDNGTGTTEHLLGDDGGEGLVVSVESLTQTPKFDVDFSDTDLTDVGLNGSKFVDAGTITLPLSGVNKEVINCVFESCGTIIVSTCNVEDCVIINANSIGCLISSESHEFSDNTIKGSTYGIEFDTAGTYSLLNVTFDTIATAHIHNTSGGTVIINASGTTNCTTYTGTTTINNTKSLTLSNLPTNTEVRCYTGIDPDTAVEIGGVENSSTSYILSHQSGGVAGYINFMNWLYEPETIYLTYPSVDSTIPIQLRVDRNSENP